MAVPGTGSIRVLVADVDPRIRNAVHDLFATDPRIRIVGTAGDGTEVLQTVKESQPDILVVDLHMPLGGAQLVRAVHEIRAGTAVVCYTAMIADREPSLLAGAAAFLLKGAPDLDLVGIVTALGGRSAACRP